jgi:hypothetical protein
MPRVDLLTWILVTKLAPTYYRKLDLMLNNVGRYRELPSWRKQFKRAWKKAEKTSITTPPNPKYRPNLQKWVCTCPQFHKSRFLICKHLVQSVHPVDPIFFLEAKRQRTAPFWIHPSLVPLDASGERPAPEVVDNDGQNEDDVDGNDSDDDPIDTTVDISTRATFHEDFTHHIQTIRDFCDGLEYQIQFNDHRMLEVLERDGGSFLRLANNCLSRERRLNSRRSGSPTTWERSTINAMYYRARSGTTRC